MQLNKKYYLLISLFSLSTFAQPLNLSNNLSDNSSNTTISTNNEIGRAHV